MWKLGQVIISTTEDRRLNNINNLFPLLRKCICNAAPYGCDKKYCLSKGNVHKMLWNALFSVHIVLHLSEMRVTHEGHVEYRLCEVWFLIAAIADDDGLLSSQAAFGSFITPLSSGQFTPFNYATRGANVCRPWRSFKNCNAVCCLRRLFYSGVTCLFDLSQQVPV